MASIEEQWAPGTPERAVADAFSAFRRRDAVRLAAVATPASMRALAARFESELDSGESPTPAGPTSEPTDSDAASVLGGLVSRLPEVFTDSVRCLILGHVLESRLIDSNRDGRGFIWHECRVSGAGDEWLSVQSYWAIDADTPDPTADVAYVVCRLAIEFRGSDIVPLHPDPVIAIARLIDGEWKLVLDEESEAGLPGFNGMGLWIDPVPAVLPPDLPKR